MNKWILVSYYTTGTGYEKLVPRFKKTAFNAGIKELSVDAVPNLKNWHANTRLKAKLIRDHLINLDGVYDALVFVDIDAIFHDFPKLFNEIEEDFACHFRNWRHAQNELLSGTLFFQINQNSRDLVEDWIRLNKAKPNIWEQRNLQRAFRRAVTLTAYKLPIEYCTIFDDKDRARIFPVIEHFQASRQLRYEVAK